MSEGKASRNFRRVAGELVVVFVGVLLALGADDFREARSAAAETRESLGLLFEDIAADSVGFARLAESEERELPWIVWLLENWDRPELPVDSVGAALWTLGERADVRLSRSAYSGLESSNRLRLLRPDSLRHALRRYYQDQQVFIAQFQAQSRKLGERLNFDLIGRYVIDPLGEEPGTLWPVTEATLELLVGWSDIQADAQLRHLLVQSGRVTGYLPELLRSGELETGRIMAMLRVELEG